MPITIVVHTPTANNATGKENRPSLTFDAPRIAIGRGDSCELRLPDPSVSNRHASVRQRGGTYLLVDEGSSNGTYLKGVKLSAQAPRVIQEGDVARFGRVWVEFRFDPTKQPSSTQATKELALGFVQRALEAMGEDSAPRIRALQGTDEGKELALLSPETPYVLGRGQGVDLLLDEEEASRRHAQLIRKADQLLLRDLGSKNGTFLDEHQLDSGKDYPLRIGDAFRIGTDLFMYENPAAEALTDIEQGADEQLRDQEVTQPPEFSHTGVHPASSQRRPIIEDEATPEPKHSQRLPVADTQGWGIGDVFIVFLAIAVFAISLGGLFLLFGSLVDQNRNLVLNKGMLRLTYRKTLSYRDAGSSILGTLRRIATM
jgi:pSer/pThr/pTyr-binding forkhead associated (FHA) protein